MFQISPRMWAESHYKPTNSQVLWELSWLWFVSGGKFFGNNTSGNLTWDPARGGHMAFSCFCRGAGPARWLIHARMWKWGALGWTSPARPSSQSYQAQQCWSTGPLPLCLVSRGSCGAEYLRYTQPRVISSWLTRPPSTPLCYHRDEGDIATCLVGLQWGLAKQVQLKCSIGHWPRTSQVPMSLPRP